MSNHFCKVFILILVIFLSETINIHAQKIDSERLSGGFGGTLLFPTSDLKKYWKNTPGISVFINYEADSHFSFAGDVNVSAFNRSSEDETIPDFYLISISSGLRYSLNITNEISAFVTPGISSNTLYFKGEYVERNFNENTIESEFGFCLTTGFKFPFLFSIESELFTRAQLILSSPDYITIYQIGFNFILI